METKYGVISDLHEDPRIIIPALKILKELGADKIILNGDIGEVVKNLELTQKHLAFILENLGKTGLECYVQPGSHEIVPGFRPVLEHFADKYDNIFSVSSIAKREYEDHHIILLPGSDIRSGEYQLGTGIPTDLYVNTGEALIPYDIAEEGMKFEGFLSFQNMCDLHDKVTDPEKTIVFCHVPRRFRNLEEAVDMAEFGEATEDFTSQFIAGGINIEKGAIIPKGLAKDFMRAGYPVELKKKNAGNEDLRNLYDELGITKAVSGHLHESGHRANDCDGNHVEENNFVDDLFWNSGHMDAGQTGILTVRDGKVSYHNIKFEGNKNGI
ncbi:MAG: metallophosphoesterase [archaeon]